MNQQPEKLFRERLENYQRPVSADAWNRIESRLDNKKDKALVFKIAASLIFLAVSGIVIWQWNAKPINSQLLTEKKPASEIKTEPAEKKKSVTPTPVVIPKPPVKNEEKAIKKKNVEPKKSLREEFQAPIVGVEKSIAIVEEKAQDQSIESEVIIELIVAEQPVVVAENNIEPKKDDTKVKIIYSVAEVDEKYLDKKALAEATSEEKKPSTLRKLWDKASDLKNNQEAFGDLRQKKNEILALNFKSEKRSQNK
jgi:hypothetical protein